MGSGEPVKMEKSSSMLIACQSSGGPLSPMLPPRGNLFSPQNSYAEGSQGRSDSMEKQEEAKRASVFSITVGRKASQAKYYLRDVQQVTELVAKLAEQTKGFARFASMPLIARPDDPRLMRQTTSEEETDEQPPSAAMHRKSFPAAQC